MNNSIASRSSREQETRSFELVFEREREEPVVELFQDPFNVLRSNLSDPFSSIATMSSDTEEDPQDPQDPAPAVM